ncbi:MULTISPECIES: DUF2206 domain-containing protein [Methanobacterium]|uniref:DUF2206 domain-containing protein n=1 Tax=Methanobacterium veterum TaxID=408577 RepID=A0A9E5A0S0_9EURY|nr:MULTISPECIES: DUF2206 domain-containing protein [Methanobacterium]MCZ3367518.1 DUF2206 domain-containing protein [Methanobacterium veterum]MCZ3373334.1 DUF2206 domain-containing protein [Methanobacterium veterum]
MLTENYIKLNNCEFKKFFRFILLIHLSLWGSLGLEFIGINIPFIREIIGLIYLVFVPGILVLRVLKLHNLSNIETILYTVGLSLTALMFTGLIISIIFPPLGIEKPLSLLPLLLSMNLFTISLLVLSYFIGNDYSKPNQIDIKISLKQLFLILPLFLSIFGSYLINYYNNNIGTMVLIIYIAIIILLVGFNKIGKNLYPLTIFIISISLLFQNSLVSNYIAGYDIQREYFVATSIINNFRWESTLFPSNWTFFSAGTTILSITTLPSYFYHVCGINLVWIFKVIYPLFFSLVPLGLFKLFKREINSKIAFFSCIYFVTSYSFFYNMLQLMREIIGEIFLVAIILLLLDTKIDKKSKSVLLVLFIFSLTVSHYGLAYIFLAIFIGVYFLQYLINKYRKQSNNDNITFNILILFLTCVLAWYLYTANSSVFISIVKIFDNIGQSFIADFLDPSSTQGLGIIVTKNTPLNTITKYLYIITQFLIVIGIMGYILKFGETVKRLKVQKNFILFAIANLIICIISIIVPNFSNQLDTVRIFQITLIVLSPFMVIGFLLILEYFPKLIIFNKKWSIRGKFNIISIFFIVFLLFNTGIIQEVFKEPYKPTMAFTSVNDPPVFNEIEVTSAGWLSKYRNDSYVYSDSNGFALLGGLTGINSRSLRYNLITNTFQDIKNGSYIYLRPTNINGELNVPQDIEGATTEGYISINSLMPIVKEKNKIYDDGSNILE